MTLIQILVFSVFLLLAGWVFRRWRLQRWLGWLLLFGSVVSVYWLQASTPIRNLDFWFPTASIGLTVFVWAVTYPREASESGMPLRLSLAGGLVIVAAILAVGLTRYLEPLCCLTPTRPPELSRVFLALGLGVVATAIPARLAPKNQILFAGIISALLVFFIILKTSGLAQAASGWLRTLSGQPASLATPFDLRWLGFSYLAFRLIHVLRDRQAGKLPPYTLGEFVTYAVFFPTYTAGPIDRSQRFIQDLRRSTNAESAEGSNSTTRLNETNNLVAGGQRILVGVFKKFVLADSLALIALNGQNAFQTTSTAWMWILLYAYAFRIYFDFSGYTDIALGLGRLAGLSLPENFDRPYLRQNLTAFWNSWHITLAQWFRAYFFNPVTRALRMQKNLNLPTWAFILIGQLSTMLLIGLWHGISWNFVAWGAWHGIGLFAHNRWSDWIRPRLAGWAENPGRLRLLQAGGWLLTFHYVTLGWVWFALPDLDSAQIVFKTLLGQ